MILSIFDFDNTLADTYWPFWEGNIFRTKTLTDTEKAIEIYERNRRGSDDIVMYKKLLEEYGITNAEKFFQDAWLSQQLFPDCVPFFQKIRKNPHIKTVILTTGDEDFQKLKLSLTWAEKLVDEVIITRNRDKINHIKDIIEKFQPEHTYVIDDRIHMSEEDFDTPITLYEMDRFHQKIGSNIIHSLSEIPIVGYSQQKIIALNWKNTQNQNSAIQLFEITKKCIRHRNIFPIIFPGDDIILDVDAWDILLGYQDFWGKIDRPYVLIGHMEKRLQGESEESIQEKLQKIALLPITPILCVGSLPERAHEDFIAVQLNSLRDYPSDKPLIIAYEPWDAIGSWRTDSLENIQKTFTAIHHVTERFSSKHILYGGSVSHTNIRSILEITDGVLVGTSSQNAESIQLLFQSLGTL